MTIKRKIITGALSAVLGISLVGGGTWAAFNDVEQVPAKVQAGTLDLAVNPKIVFDVPNLKPGDKMRRNFEITNAGTLDIEKVLMHTSYDVFNKQGKKVNDKALAREFADQYLVTFFTTDGAKIADGLDKTLAELKEKTDKNQSIDITTFIKVITKDNDLPVGDTDKIVMELFFKDNVTRENNSRKFVQNKFQGYSLKLKFDLEATQYKGAEK
ncbi:TasA family protein [Bacillus sp. 1P06AnD]|uniref:TasA family protein n=1 Tax=Bacillus sp. 1P06AnD TaxID=3132208 RepID=UPI00399F1B09